MANYKFDVKSPNFVVYLMHFIKRLECGFLTKFQVPQCDSVVSVIHYQNSNVTCDFFNNVQRLSAIP